MGDTNKDENTDEPLTLERLLDFSQKKCEDEAEAFEGDLPKHSTGLLNARAADVQTTVTQMDVALASEKTDDHEDEVRERTATQIEEDCVDVLLAVGAVTHEYDLDLTDAVEQRMNFIEAYEQFEDALEDVETREEALETMDDHFEAEMRDATSEPAIGGGIEAGTNVDDEDYDADDDRDRHFM